MWDSSAPFPSMASRTPTRLQHMIKDLIDSTLILEELQSCEKMAVLDEVLKAAVEAELIGPRVVKKVRKKLVEREDLGSTGIGNGIAVPHVKDAGIKRISIVLARSNEGIDFAAVDGREVNTVFMIFAPVDHADEHLRILRWISGLARNADFRRFVRNASGETEIRELLHEMSSE